MPQTSNNVSPWGDKGWITVNKSPLAPACHANAKIFMSRGDGVFMGHCSECDNLIVRINPRTGNTEVPE